MSLTERAPLRAAPPEAESITVETITPVDAARYLESNRSNRTIRNTAVEQYAADMAAGLWTPVTSTQIIFDVDGNLINGQHRMLACLKANTSFRNIVVRGAAPEAQKTVDTGVKRTLSDTFVWREEPNASNLAAAVRAGWLWKVNKSLSKPRKLAPSNHQAIEWLERNPSIRDCVAPSLRIYKAVKAPPAISAVVLHRARMVAPRRADDFLEGLVTGADLGVRSPVLALRNWMINTEKMSPRSRKPEGYGYWTVWVRAWNAAMAGRDLANVKMQVEETLMMMGPNLMPVPLVDEIDMR